MKELLIIKKIKLAKLAILCIQVKLMSTFEIYIFINIFLDIYLIILEYFSKKYIKIKIILYKKNF